MVAFNLKEKGNGEGSEDSLKASTKGKGSWMGIGLVVVSSFLVSFRGGLSRPL